MAQHGNITVQYLCIDGEEKERCSTAHSECTCAMRRVRSVELESESDMLLDSYGH